METFGVHHNKEFTEHLDRWLRGRDLIVKVQLPLAGSAGKRPPALVYDQERRIDCFVQVDDRLIKFVDAQPKAFVKARVGKDYIEFHAIAPHQGW